MTAKRLAGCVLSLVVVFVFAWPGIAQTAQCDLSGATHLDLRRYFPRPSRAAESADAGVMSAPELWSGESTWVGYEAGGFSSQHLAAKRYAFVRYYDASGALLHLIDIKFDGDSLYVIIMPANRHAGDWHGCASFRQPATGQVETWLDALIG